MHSRPSAAATIYNYNYLPAYLCSTTPNMYFDVKNRFKVKHRKLMDEVSTFNCAPFQFQFAAIVNLDFITQTDTLHVYHE